jgi:hypothetical protein
MLTPAARRGDEFVMKQPHIPAGREGPTEAVLKLQPAGSIGEATSLRSTAPLSQLVRTSLTRNDQVAQTASDI